MQQVFWSAVYMLVVALIAACAVLTFRSARRPDLDVEPDADEPLSAARRLRWTVLAAVPSALMLAVTFHISTDIAAVPLLWIVPLAVYLSTFIAVFSTAAGRIVATRRGPK